MSGTHFVQRCLQGGLFTAHNGRQARHILGGSECTCRFCISVVWKASKQFKQWRIKNIPGDTARLAQHMNRCLGVASGLVVKPLTQCVHLNTTLHDKGPRHEGTLGGDPRAVSLVGV